MLLANAKGTAPASPSGMIYDDFAQAIKNTLGVDANANSFLAHAYDATYVGGFGVAYASQKGNAWDGLDVAEGMSHLSAGQEVDLTGVDAWITGTGVLAKDGQINIVGTSGPLDFDASLGEAPGPVEIWSVVSGAYSTDKVISP
jgi:branched-chain amino acid transport system substrate-binding protein